jgi:hypothetical protein
MKSFSPTTSAGILVLVGCLLSCTVASAQSDPATFPSAPRLPADPSESLFKPDIYPSSHAALNGLMSDLTASISSALNADTQIVVRFARSNGLGSIGDAAVDAVTQQRARELSESLSSSFPQATVEINSSSATRPADSIDVLISLTGAKVSSVNWLHRPTVSGTLNIVVSLPNDPKAKNRLSAKFADKPWLDDTQEFIAKETSHPWRVVKWGPMESQRAATARVARLAAEGLAPLVNVSNGTTSIECIEQQLLKPNDIIVDRFVQSFSRPYGTVYSAAWLLDSSPDKIRTLATAAYKFNYTITAARAAKTKQAESTLLQVLGFLAVVVVLYWFLNAATKGYFTWQLRIGAVLLTLAGTLALVVLAGYLALGRQGVVIHP